MGGSTPQQQSQNSTQNSSQNSTQNSTQNQQFSNNGSAGPNPMIAGDLAGVLANLRGQYGANPAPPGYFPSTTVAQPGGQTQQGWQDLTNISKTGIGGTTDEKNQALVNSTLAGNFLDPSKNPYLQAGLGAGFAQQNRTYMDTINPGVRAQFAAAGRTGGSNDFDTTERGIEGLDRSQATAAAQAEAGAYSDERQRQLATQAQLPGMLQMKMQEAGAGATSGAAQDAYRQAMINQDMDRYKYSFLAPQNYASDFASRFLSAYPGGATTGGGTSSGGMQGGMQSSGTGSSNGYSAFTPASNGMSDIMSGITGIGSMATKAIPLFGGLF